MRFYLFDQISPFQRCLACNAVLRPVPKEAVLSRRLAAVREYCNEFTMCPECDRVYWQGTHYERMKDSILHITDVNVF